MTRIQIDAAMRERLLGLTSVVELCDETGKVLARVEPVYGFSDYEIVGGELSEEELDRRFESKGPRYTTAQVLARLESLDV